MSQSIDRALEAFESALRYAPFAGLRDLHEALQTGQLAVQGYGKADLVRGNWGTLGACAPAERYSACPLNALYARWATWQQRGLAYAVETMRLTMAIDGYTPEDFYVAWDRGLLAPKELLARVERHLEARLDAAYAAEPACS
jgi:hypothetical protein